jgi:flagellar hook-associated protein 3 FlgL
MRITGTRMIDLAAAATSKNQAAVATTAEQMSSGLRVTTPSDDPSAWLAAQRARMRQALSQGTGAAITESRDRLSLTDDALANMGDLVSQIQSIAVQGSSDTIGASGRAALGAQVRGLFRNALGAANARGTDGEYLLAGSASLTPPFDAAGVYQGNASVRTGPNDTGLGSDVTIPGSELTAARGLDILPLLDRVATALTNNDLPTLLASIPDLSTAVRQISTTRSRTGGAMATLDQTTLARGALEQNMSNAIQRYVEVDAIGAASELAKASQSLEVSQAVSSRIIQLLRTQG